MEKEISETYMFNPSDYIDGRRKSDGKSFRNIVSLFEYDFHRCHSTEYASNLYANLSTMQLLEKSCNAASFLSYGMDLISGNSFDPVSDPYINHNMEKHSQNIIVYGIDSAYMKNADGSVVIDSQRGIYPLTLLIDDTMENGTVRISVPTSDDENDEETVTIDSPKCEYV